MHVEIYLFLFYWEIDHVLREYLLFEGNWVNDEIHIHMIFEVLKKTKIQTPGTLQRELIEGNINLLNGWVKCKQNKFLKVLNRDILNLIVR